MGEKRKSVKVFNEWNKLASKTDNIGTIFHTKHAAAHTNTPNTSCTFTKCMFMRPQSERVCLCPCASALTHESENWVEGSITFDHRNGLKMASLLNHACTHRCTQAVWRYMESPNTIWCLDFILKSNQLKSVVNISWKFSLTELQLSHKNQLQFELCVWTLFKMSSWRWVRSIVSNTHWAVCNILYVYITVC